MQKFAYEVVVRTLANDGSWEWSDRTHSGTSVDVMNKLGAEGWELVNVVPIAGFRTKNVPTAGMNGRSEFLHYVFKRPL